MRLHFRCKITMFWERDALFENCENPLNKNEFPIKFKAMITDIGLK
jgi:hypothetical protein